MKIRSIHIYSHDGQRRDLSFKIDGLNVITGRSSTGKSALSDIIEYCMGSSSFKIPEGIIRDKVSWFAVIYQFKHEQVLVAKPTPARSAASCSTSMMRRGPQVEIPDFKNLKVNSDDATITELLSRLLGIPENRTEVALDHSRSSFKATINHTHYYLFQKQGLVANKDHLFYRQSEPYLPQTIRDTLPILLGASSNNRYELDSKLRVARRELKICSKELEQALSADDASHEQAQSLYAEAYTTGIISRTDENPNLDTITEALTSALSWTPDVIPDDNESHISLLEEELVGLRRERRDIQARMDAAQHFAKRAKGYETEATEQTARLASIRALPRDSDNGEWQWPFSEKNFAMDSPIAVALLTELRTLEDELRIATLQHPKLDAYISELAEAADKIIGAIKKKEAELSAAISANEIAIQMGVRNYAAARVIGRISFFLESLRPREDHARLEDTIQRLKTRVLKLEKELSTDDSDERLESVLNKISTQISKYVKDFVAEFSPYPARLDLKRLTIVFDRPDRPVPMNRTGGGENHLAYHLSALLALHLVAAQDNRPFPRFLLIDQPTQVYFPSEKVYKEIDGSVQKTTDADVDLETVRRLFKLLLKYTQVDVPGFQLIVTEHANLSDQWFQDSLIEEPWSKPPALVPEDWPTEPPADQSGH